MASIRLTLAQGPLSGTRSAGVQAGDQIRCRTLKTFYGKHVDRHDCDATCRRQANIHLESAHCWRTGRGVPRCNSCWAGGDSMPHDFANHDRTPIGLDDEDLLPCGCRWSESMVELWAVNKGIWSERQSGAGGRFGVICVCDGTRADDRDDADLCCRRWAAIPASFLPIQSSFSSAPPISTPFARNRRS